MKYFGITLCVAVATGSFACATQVGSTDSNDGFREDSADTIRTGTFPGPDGPITAAYVSQGEYALVGGDMIFPLHAVNRHAAAAAGPAQRWPGGIVPYLISDNLANAPEVQQAVAMWNAVSNQTGVTLVARTNQQDFIQIIGTNKNQCFSALGYQGGHQIINVDGCPAGSVAHEFGHAIGLVHEHARTDRDEYITFDYSNVVGGKDSALIKVNLGIATGSKTYSTYDPGSIMHYPAYVSDPRFAIDPNKPIFTSKIPGIGPEVFGQISRLSPRDISGVAAMYEGIGGAGTGGGTGGGGTGGGGTGGGGTGGGGTGGTTNACAYPCTDYGLTEGQCDIYTTGSFGCSAGCMTPVPACENGGSGGGTSGDFVCGDGTRIPASYECDGYHDCFDSSDENNCAGVAGAASFACGNGISVPAAYECDGYQDCGNNADEDNCGSGGESATYTCFSGELIPLGYLCDQVVDCGDGSDEFGC